MIKIQMNQKYLIKSPFSGNVDFDQNVADYRENLLTWGCQPKKEGDLITIELINGVKLDVNDFLFVMSKDDGGVSYYNPFVKVDADYIDEAVPSDLSNSTYFVLDSENNMIIHPHTWRTWRDSVHELFLIDDYYYFISSTFGNTLSCKDLLLIHGADGVELVDNMPIIDTEQQNI